MTYIGLNGGQKQDRHRKSETGVSDLDTRTHVITFFDDKFASHKEEEEWTLPDLAGEIQDRSERSKAKLPWLKMARFGDVRSDKNSLRTNANMAAISGIELDYDAAQMPFEDAVEACRAARLRCLLYTSASYVRGSREKWRVLAPLSELASPDLREGYAAAVNAIIGGVAARESFVKSTAFYYGFVKGNSGHRVEVLDGDFIDCRPDLLVNKAYPEPIAKKRLENPRENTLITPARDFDEIEGLLKASRKVNKSGERQWHNAMLQATASMIGKGWSDQAIYEACQAYCDGGWGDADIAELIRTGRDKWGVPDPGTVVDRMGPIVAQAIEATGYQVPDTEPNWRERYANTRPKPSLHNARLAIEAAGLRCSEDVFHHKMLVGRSDAAAPGERLLSCIGEMTDGRLLSMRLWLSDRYGLDFTEKHVRDAAMGLAHENPFDPVCDMLDEAEASWDGVARLDRMAVDYFNCEDTEVNRQCVRKTMIAAVARARKPGCKFDTILVMESPEGKFKSSAWVVLAGESNFSDEPIIGKSGREVIEQLAGVWIHENADLAGMKKADVDAVKSFASRQVDRARPAYGHFLIEQPRRSIEVGTTNARRYLLSQTGNRRFWPIVINGFIDLGKLKKDRLQLWGEAAHYERAGESLVLDQRLWPAIEAEQEERRAVHPWEALIAGMTAIPHSGPVAGVGYIGNGIVHQVDDEERVASWVIFEHVLKVPTGQMHNGHSKTLAEIMRRQGWQERLFKLDGKPTRGYVRKVKKVS